MEISLPQEKPKTQYIWRYIDSYKFMSFLQFPSLRFTRLDMFDDFFEGYGSDSITLSGLLQSSDYSPQKKELSSLIEIIPNMIYINYQLHKQNQEKYFALCFFPSETESLQMWKTYGSQSGIALRFNTKSIMDLILCESELKDKFEIFYGQIEYLDFFSRTAPRSKALLSSDFNPFYKDSIYSSENEFRIILKNKNDSDITNPPMIPLVEIIDKITVFTFPSIDEWEFLTIKNSVEKYGYSKLEVAKSIIITKEILDKIEKKAIYNGLEKLADKISNLK